MHCFLIYVLVLHGWVLAGELRLGGGYVARIRYVISLLLMSSSRGRYYSRLLQKIVEIHSIFTLLRICELRFMPI